MALAVLAGKLGVPPGQREPALLGEVRAVGRKLRVGGRRVVVLERVRRLRFSRVDGARLLHRRVEAQLFDRCGLGPATRRTDELLGDVHHQQHVQRRNVVGVDLVAP